MPSEYSRDISAWNKAKVEAAALYAIGDLSNEDICLKVGVGLKTFSKWLREANFIKKVDECLEKIENQVLRKGIAVKRNRIKALQDRHEKLAALIEARGLDPNMADIPGGNLGVLTRTVKQIGSGSKAQIIEEFRFDASVFKEMREIEKQASIELGQWVEQTNSLGGAPPVALTQVVVNTREEAQAVLARLANEDKGLISYEESNPSEERLEVPASYDPGTEPPLQSEPNSSVADPNTPPTP